MFHLEIYHLETYKDKNDVEICIYSHENENYYPLEYFCHIKKFLEEQIDCLIKAEVVLFGEEEKKSYFDLTKIIATNFPRGVPAFEIHYEYEYRSGKRQMRVEIKYTDINDFLESCYRHNKIDSLSDYLKEFVITMNHIENMELGIQQKISKSIAELQDDFRNQMGILLKFHKELDNDGVSNAWKQAFWRAKKKAVNALCALWRQSLRQGREGLEIDPEAYPEGSFGHHLMDILNTE